MPEWKSGQVARLKSGGPAMTVSGVVGGVVVCQWFEGKKTLTGQFAPETLEELRRVPDSTPGPLNRDLGRGFIW